MEFTISLDMWRKAIDLYLAIMICPIRLRDRPDLKVVLETWFAQGKTAREVATDITARTFRDPFESWLHGINTRLVWYCGLKLAELPVTAGALNTWYMGGASAWLVGFCLAAFIEGE